MFLLLVDLEMLRQLFKCPFDVDILKGKCEFLQCANQTVKCRTFPFSYCVSVSFHHGHLRISPLTLSHTPLPIQWPRQGVIPLFFWYCINASRCRICGVCNGSLAAE